MGSDKVKNISCCIIAGGKSGRFGSDKSLYIYNGKPLISHVYDAVKPLFEDICIIATDNGKFTFLGAEIIPDIIPGLGPIGGIYTALESGRSGRIFVLPCDMPFISSDFVSYMSAITGDYDIIVPVVNDRYQPLHAIYSVKCSERIRRKIDAEDYRMSGFFEGHRIRVVSEDEISRFDDPMRLFRNVNFRVDIDNL